MKVLSVIGWLLTAVGSLILGLCLYQIFNRSPDDFEGLAFAGSVVVIITVAFPAVVAGLSLVVFTNRKKNRPAT